ncbi:TPA_asm: HNH endonuclease [Listeria monocytogenes]|nr:HNH endonuclease [Listeria monocytogenes]
MYNFRVISANEDIFIKTKYRFISELEDFKEFAQTLTDDAGKAKVKSGKASSYTRYLIRLIIFYCETHRDNLEELSSFEAVKKLEKIRLDESFKAFNQESNRFYSATLSCYLAYVTFKNSDAEEIIDNQIISGLNNFENQAQVVKENKSTYLVRVPKSRDSKRKNNNVYSYPRNYVEAIEARRRCGWICEFNQEHKTFINIKDGKPYVEGHHLIPMAVQDYYDNTIDFADNIICLCPTCHRKIHYAVQSEKKEMLIKIFNEREKFYLQHGIEIDRKTLLSFYGIF